MIMALSNTEANRKVKLEMDYKRSVTTILKDIKETRLKKNYLLKLTKN